MKKKFKREFIREKGKYISLFLFLVITIGFISGFIVADDSIKYSYDGSFERLNIEDGHFTVGDLLSADGEEELSKKADVKLYRLFNKEEKLINGSKIRIFITRESVNKQDVLEGNLPENINEIAIDRLFAIKNKYKIGDTVTLDSKSGKLKYKLVGFVALGDYSALFEKNSDTMFNAKKFGVAVVNKKTFNSIDDDNIKYTYAWKNNEKLSLNKQKKTGEKIAKLITLQSVQKLYGEKVYEEKRNTGFSDNLKDLLIRDDNQAIMFSGNDLGSDRGTFITLMYILMVVIAFVFAVTTRSTIEKDSGAIGTLLAMGYSKRELILHYLTLPLTTTLISALIGNIIGYTWLKGVMAKLYYNSYSLMKYETVWSPQAFVLTTLFPLIIIFIVNILVLVICFRTSPLDFIKHRLNKKNGKRAIKLPDIKFISRFRIRIILQNKMAYMVLFCGIFLASVLLMSGLMLDPMLEHYGEEALKSKIANYQYVLKSPTELPSYNEDVRNSDKPLKHEKMPEKYSVKSLNITEKEEVSVYGIERDSRYLKLNVPKKENRVIASTGYLEKYELKIGDKITIKEKYTGKKYTMKIVGKYRYSTGLALFMERRIFNSNFGYDGEYFNGYFANEEIKDISSRDVYSTISEGDLTKLTHQLKDSMGGPFRFITIFSTSLYLLVMYILAKLIVDKNSDSISMIKILGYSKKEIGSLYNYATYIVVIISLVVSTFLSDLVIQLLWKYFMMEIRGWIPYYIPKYNYVIMVIIGIIAYFPVQKILLKRIQSIPMSQVIKDME